MSELMEKDDVYVHLLGASLPQEFMYYDGYDFLKSVDTSNPILVGANKETYKDFGSLYMAMFVGTMVGLVCKYVLDKKFIFYHTPNTKMHDLKKFIAYAFTGIFTTIIFWGTEIEFNVYFKDENAKYVGAIIGLSFGYITKYFLDKKYVFNRKALEL
jgi:putative flippase GtrA